MKLFQFPPSGNCYKVRLLLSQLEIPVEIVNLDIQKGETRTDKFRTINPVAKVPTIELEPGVYLPESNAILWYFAEGTPFLPSDRLARARVLQWMFFEQYSHEPYISVARNWISYVGVPKGKEAELKERQERGRFALEVMNQALQNKNFFVENTYTIADIALYAYTHVANEGGFDLELYPAVRVWLDRVAAQPLHIGIKQ